MNDNSLIAEIEGYAAVFHNRDLNGDMIFPGAFAKSLKRRDAPVRMLYQHASETPIGRWTSLVEDARGLFVTGEILLSSPTAREVYALLKGGALDGLSIGYQTVKARKDIAGGRRIIEADLWEVSIVTFPMAPSARLTHIGAPFSNLEDEPHSPLPHRVLFPPQDPMRITSGPLLQPGGRTSGSPTPDVRHFADALRTAAQNILV